MIENKVVVIKKQNTFDKGWALFTPCRDIPMRNTSFQSVSVEDIVRQITYATEITLLLSKACLSRKIIEELKWVQSYAKIHVVAKSEGVLAWYNEISFASKKFAPDLSLDYIGVQGKEGKKSYFIADGFQQTDDTVEKLDGTTKGLDLSVLLGADKLILLRESYVEWQGAIFEFCEKNGIKAYYMQSIREFSRTDYQRFVNSKVEMLVSTLVGEAFLVAKEGKLYSVTILKGTLILIELDNVCKYFGENIFVNQKKGEILTGAEIPENAYILAEGKLNKLEQKPCHFIEREVQIATMADFIANNFDGSEAEQHNDFSAIAKSVEYRFTLVPPLFSEGFVISNIYDMAKKLLSKWKKKFALDVAEIESEVSVFEDNQKFKKLLQEIVDTDETVRYVIEKYEYVQYHSILSKRKKTLLSAKQSLLDCCLPLSDAISVEISGTQNSKIDDEIAGYERTIREKEALIEQNVEVLQSKRRIEILRKKIADLIKIKGQFSTKQTANNQSSQTEFIAFYNTVLSGKRIPRAEEDSVSSIVNSKEQTKKEQLEVFLQKWLKKIDDTLETLIDILTEMEGIDVPEEYLVYDYEGKRYTVIDDIEDYEQTKEIQEKYDLQCVTRR